MGRLLPTELRDRLRPILMLLSSPHDGETLAAARSIGRLLQKHGCDWTDLSDQVVGNGAVAPLPQSHAPQPAWGAGTGGRQLDAAQLLGIVEAIRKSGSWPSANAREFLNSLECKAVAYPSVTLSERQHQWLVDLAAEAAAEKV